MTDIRDIYQAKLKADIYNAWNGGARNVLAVLPTGGGKSVVSSGITLEKSFLGATQAVIAHRTELVSQMSNHVAGRGVKHRIIAPKPVVAQIIREHRRDFNGQSFVNPDAHCSVIGVDTQIARQAELTQWANQVDFFTIDEGHHCLAANKWGKAALMFPRAYGLLISASPSRADGMGLGRHHDGIVDAMVVGPTMRELIDMGALCDYEIAVPEGDFSVDEDDFSKDGELSPAKGRLASKRSHIVGDVVTEYIKRAYGKRAICFATDVETAGEIAANFNTFGIAAVAVSAKTPSEVRAEYIRRFRAGQLTVLVNVDLFGEGFDVPAVEVVIMARPTASLAVYLQQFGRALRILAGKAYGLVIDHVSNWKRHGFPDKHHYWSLDRRDKKAKKERDPEDIELTACRKCSKPYPRVLPVCKWCGEAPPLPAPGSRTLEAVDGDLMLLDRERLAELRAATILPTPADVGNRVNHVAGPIAAKAQQNHATARIEAQQRLSAAVAQWAGIQRAKGRTDQESYRRFFLASGVDVLSALALKRDEMDGLAVKIEGWCGL